MKPSLGIKNRAMHIHMLFFSPYYVTVRMGDLKTYINKNLGQFTSIPIKLMDDSSQLDYLYLSSHFHKLRTRPVAAIRKSKHYAETLAAWHKNLKGVDVSDLAAVAKTLGLNVEVFNPLASSSEPRTLFSGGGRSKRKAQLLKVKKGVYKPMMKAGAIIDDPSFPPDVMRDVVGRLNRDDRSSLLDVSEEVREDTLAVMDPQERLWHAARLLSTKHVKTALRAGARVNKIDPSVGMNALKMIEDRDGMLGDFLRNRGAKAHNQDTLNEELCETIGTRPDNGHNNTEDDPAIALSRVKEVILDGADMYAQLHFSKYVPYSSFDLNGRSMQTSNIMNYSIFKAKLRPSEYLPWIKALIELGYDVNKMIKDPGSGKGKYDNAMMFATTIYNPHYLDLDDVLNPPDRHDPNPQGFYATQRGEEVRLARIDYLSALDKSEVVGSRTEIIKLLLTAPNVNVNAGQFHRSTPQHDTDWVRGGRTALHQLCEVRPKDDGLSQENLAIARLLLDAGADVGIIQFKNNNTIHTIQTVLDSAEYNEFYYAGSPSPADQALINLIASAEIDRNEKMQDFLKAAEDGNLELVKRFINQGVSVNICDQSGNTPLRKASVNGNIQIVRELLAAPHIFVNAMPSAVTHGYNGLEFTDQVVGTPLFWSAMYGRLEVVRALIEAGADVNAKTNNDVSPLYMCAQEGHLEVARALIEAGADVNAKGKYDRTPLHSSAEYGHLEVARLLIDNGADVNAKEDDMGRSPLFRSALNGHLEVVRALIQAGADVNAKDRFGQTPLHKSAEMNRLDVARALIEAGADVNARNREYLRPVDINPRMAEFQQNGVRPRQAEDHDQGQDRNVRQRVGGGGNNDVDVDFNADSRGARYSKDDTKLAKAIEVLFRKMNDVSMKNELRTKLLSLS